MDTFFPQLMIAYLSSFRQAFSKPNWIYFQSFIFALLLVEGRKCVTNIAEVCFFVERSLSSFQRFLSEYHWDLTEVIDHLVRLFLRELKDEMKIYGAYLMAIDTSIVSKSSKKMIGIQKWKDHSGDADRGEYMIGHHWAIGALISSFGDRFLCWPIFCRLISGKLNPFCFVATEDGKIRRANIWDSATAVAFRIALSLGGIPSYGGPRMRVVVDAFFSRAPFINPMIEAGIDVISRLRHDAVGWDDPPFYCGRGRPRKKGRKWKLSDLLTAYTPKELKVNIYGKDCLVRCVVKDVWLREISSKVKVVVIEGMKRPSILMSTDLSLSAEKIIRIYASRFSLEIAIRDLKGHFGFGDYQCTSPIGFFRFIHLCCFSFCLWRLMLLPKNASSWIYKASPKMTFESELSFARARRALRRFVLGKIIFSKFAPEANLQKIEDEFEPLFRIAA